jgi:ribosomal protein S15P/S13E
LIASRRPEEIAELVERYNKIQKDLESNYLDIVIRSEGAISYQDVMQMPVDSIKLLIERMNNRVEEINKSRSGSVR